MKTFLSLVIWILPTMVYSANILGVFPVPSFSHQKAFLNLVKELSFRGHQITIVTTDPLKDKSLINLTEIDMSHLYEFLDNKGFYKTLSSDKSLWSVLNGLRDTFDATAESIFETKEMQHLINSNIHFDLIIVESHDAVFFALGNKFSAPVIGKYSIPSSS